MVREYIDFQILPKAVDFKADIVNISEVKRFNRTDVEIELAFTQPVDKESAENASNYYIDGKLLVDEAIVERDGITVTLVIRDMDEDTFISKYNTLEISPRVLNLSRTAYLAENDRFLDLLSNDERAAKKVEDLIKALPKVEDINAENLEDVREKAEKAREAYEALTSAQKDYVSISNYNKLVAVENKIKALDEEAAKKEEEAKVKAIKEANLLNIIEALEDAGIARVLPALASEYVDEFGDAKDLKDVQGIVDRINANWAIEDATFDGQVLTVEVNDAIKPVALEVDNNLDKYEFTVAAKSFTGEELAELLDIEIEGIDFKNASVTFENNTWTINFGVDIKNLLSVSKFYLKVIDEDGFEYGSMYNGGYYTVQ